MAFGSLFPIRRRRAVRGVAVEQHVRLDRCQFIGPCRIGFRSYANDSVLRDCDIGRFCSIGRRCSIGAARHALDRLSTNPFFDTDGNDRPLTSIGNDVWIGDGAVIMAGLEIGNGAVIGANAVVTKNVAPFAIVVGIPARVLRMRFDAETIERLEGSRWWAYGDACVGGATIGDCLARLATARELAPHFTPYVR